MADPIGGLIIAAGIAAAGGETALGIAGVEMIAGANIFGISLSTIVGTAAIAGVAVGLQYALNNPDTPTPESGSQALKASIAPRIMGYGTNRLAGYYMLYEAMGAPPATSYDVTVIHSGPITHIDFMYLNDDQIITDGDINGGGQIPVIGSYGEDERYRGGKVWLEARLGQPGQTALYGFTSDPKINGIWTEQHVGNDMAYIGMRCFGPPTAPEFTRIFPRGHPELSAVCKCAPVWDARLGQSRTDKSTWTVSYNPVIQLIDYLTRVDGGMGLDYATAIAPNLSAWMYEADVCDEMVDRADGLRETRYSSSGWFEFNNSPENVINSILATCDGWLAESGDGTLSITVGLYRPPTEPALTERDIFGFALNYGQTDEQMVNQLDISFTDQLQKFVTVQTQPWRDEDSIAQAGTVRAQPLNLTWVQSNAQARRLASRAMKRINPLMSGSFTTTLYGLRYLGKRWVSVQYPFVSGLQDSVVEIQNVEVDLMGGRIRFDFLLVLPEFIEAYDPAADEGGRPPIPPAAAPMSWMHEDNSQYIREDGSALARESV
jgi:hypothetical protein